MSLEKNCKLTQRVKTFRPLPNQWALEFFNIQQNQHWLPNEIDFLSDYEDYQRILTNEQREILKKALMLFTQLDTEVARCYIDYYIKYFKAHDIRMMLMSFANMEGIHMLAYDKLNTTLNLPTEFYGEFLQIKEMYDKYDFMQSFDISNPYGVALSLALISGFGEGVMLFASFAIIMYFPVKLKCVVGIGQVVSLSMKDEAVHVAGMIKLYNEYIKERKSEIDLKKLHEEIIFHCKEVVDREIAAINYIYGDVKLKDLKKEDIIDFVKYFADLRLKQLGIKTQLYNIKEHNLQWMNDVMRLDEVANFFESTSVSYSKAQQKTSWSNLDNILQQDL